MHVWMRTHICMYSVSTYIDVPIPAENWKREAKESDRNNQRIQRGQKIDIPSTYAAGNPPTPYIDDTQVYMQRSVHMYVCVYVYV